MDQQKKFVSIVAYLYNRDRFVGEFIGKVMGKCRDLFEKCELILVDDASADSSVSTVKECLAGMQGAGFMTSVIRMSVHQGLEAAMNAGRDLAIGDFVYEFDDVLVDYDPELMEEAYGKCASGADVVSVSPDCKLRLSSSLFYRVYNKFSGTQAPIGRETFRLLSRRAVNRVEEMGSCIPYRKAVYMNSGLRTERIVYKPAAVSGGRRNADGRFGLGMDTLIYFTNVMEKVSFAISVIFFVIALGIIIYVICSLFMDEHLSSGWVSTMGFMSIGFVGIFTLITIMMRYLSVIVNLIFKQKKYLIEDIEKISGE